MPQNARTATYLGPTPYLQSADSPFEGLHFEYFHLETFEDGLLNTPGIGINYGTVASPQPAVDSVDADDGSVDGSGVGGHSWHSGYATNVLTFTFGAAALGSLPTHAGIVWTDSADPFFDSVSLEAFDATGASLGIFGPFLLGDGNKFGQTAEDRFLGVVEPRGISAFKISTQTSRDWEVDHLQYGFAVLPTISKVGDNVVVKWRQSSTLWTLQVASNLSAPDWSDTTNAPVLAEGYWTVTNPATGFGQFYRLRR